MAHERHPAVTLLFIKKFYCLIREISEAAHEKRESVSR